MDALELAGPVLFLSTLSLRRATWADTDYNLSDIISIHALLAESDAGVSTHCKAVPDFYPRSPCGERQSASYNAYLEESISIHALLAESDMGLDGRFKL